MLFKSHATRFLDDFGLELNSSTVPRETLSYFRNRGLRSENRPVYLYENENLVKMKSLKASPVVRMNVLWMLKDLKLKCKVASTVRQKRQGLQGKTLDQGEGLFFPYAGPTDVVFHQGSVSYPLDIIFVRNSRVAKIEADTRVGGSDKWGCSACESVIETLGGFCFENDVNVGDQLVYFAISAQDEIDLQNERAENISFMPLAAELI